MHKFNNVSTRGMPYYDFQNTLVSQRAGIASGTALQRHADDAHGGQVNETCPACKEIQDRARFLNGTKQT